MKILETTRKQVEIEYIWGEQPKVDEFLSQGKYEIYFQEVPTASRSKGKVLAVELTSLTIES